MDTDGAGNILQLLDYFPFGDTRIDEQFGEYENDYKFTGKEKDEDTGLYYYEARYYNSAIGRFISLDSWFGDISDPQSLNKYAYVRNNPLKYTDPSGMCAWDACITEGIAVKAAITGIITWLTYDHFASTPIIPDLSNEPIVNDPQVEPSEPIADPVPETAAPDLSTPIPEQNNDVLYTPIAPVENTTIFTPIPEPTTTGCGVTMSCAVPDQHSLGTTGVPNSTDLRWKNGEVVQGRTFGEDGRPTVDTDLTDHGNPAAHPDVPHVHEWKENSETEKLDRDKTPKKLD